ncbi:sphingosine 1-phosphate receptor 4 [Lacerta agilis]|uniref:sphingosine 1-phosphate receptor 4 n=1 Tax=Lacerta agilis TaxID=80427 RepID=UPI001419368E|nr:sphingosine 1-phosphate receptor 4 [Lacerta agilis]
MTDMELFISTSSPSPWAALPTSVPEPRLASAHRPELCYPTTDANHVNIILYHYNFTGRMKNRRPQEDQMSVLKMVIVAASCLIILENLVVLVAIIRKVRTRRWVYSCLASITLSDLLAGTAYLLNLCLSGSRTFQLSPAMWFLREGVLFVALAASTFSLLVTAVERYSTMVKPIAEKESSKTTRLRGLLAFCWSLAILIGLLPLLGWNCICNVSRCSTLLPLYDKNYILFVVIMFSIILVGVVGLYASIYCWVQKSAQQTFSRCSRKRSLRLLKTVLVILCTFLICWTPLFILLLIDTFWGNTAWAPHKVFGWVLTLAVTNSLINPIIYSLGSKEVRRAVVELLCCCCIWAGVRGPRNCLVASDIHASSSTGSLRVRGSFRSPVAFSRRTREPLSSNSSVLSNETSGLHHTLD